MLTPGIDICPNCGCNPLVLDAASRQMIVASDYEAVCSVCHFSVWKLEEMDNKSLYLKFNRDEWKFKGNPYAIEIEDK